MNWGILVTNRNVSEEAQTEFEIIAPGNTLTGQDGNWRFIVDEAGAFVVQKLISGTWTNVDKKQKK
jgi:hypothetical protein